MSVDMDDLLDLERQFKSESRKTYDDLESIRSEVADLRKMVGELIKVAKAQAGQIRGVFNTLEALCPDRSDDL